MPKTAAELRDRVGNTLGILQLNGTLADQNKTRIDDGYAEVYAELKSEGIATWAFSSSVPDEFVPHVVNLVAKNCSVDMKISLERIALIEQGALIAKPEIRKYALPEYTSTGQAEDF